MAPNTKPPTITPPATKPPTTKPATRPGSPSIDDLLDELQAVASAPPIYDGYFPIHPPQKLTTATAPFVSLADEGISMIPPLRNYPTEPFLPSIVPTLQLEYEDSMYPRSFDPILNITPTLTLETDLRVCPERKYVEPQLFEGITVGPITLPVIQHLTIADGVYHPEPSQTPPSASELSALIRWDLIKDPEPRRQPCESPKPGEPRKLVVVPVMSSGTPAGVPGYEALTLKRKAAGPVERNMFGEDAENPWKKLKLEEECFSWASSSSSSSPSSSSVQVQNDRRPRGARRPATV
ncbi:hypothetical protein BDZ89DRAFT_785291 [Hymenopellis radicata]|nr:hypothetical protein BDZ89DRAFT_785291 [Hymenopellis radicata]